MIWGPCWHFWRQRHAHWSGGKFCWTCCDGRYDIRRVK